MENKAEVIGKIHGSIPSNRFVENKLITNFRIMINVFSFSKIYGGTEFNVQQLATVLARKGYLLYVVTRRDRNLPTNELKDKNYYIYRIPRIEIPLIGPFLYSFFVFCLAVLLKPNVVLDMGLHGAGFFTRLIARRPYIVWGRGSDIYSTKAPLQRILAGLVLKTASCVFALSNDMKKQIMMRLANVEVTIVPNGIDVKEYRKALMKASEKRFGRKQLLFVGNVRPVKGVEYLIRAMPIILREEPNAYLVIVGSYPPNFVEKIPEDLKDKVILTGFVNHEEIPAYMKGSDIFILPSLSEGFPNVLLEAMVSGLPIVATNVGGVPEIISNGENGFLIQPKSSKQLAEKVLLLLKDENLYKRISKNNLQKVETYDINRIIYRLEKYMHYVT